jgi:hypothetical protein
VQVLRNVIDGFSGDGIRAQGNLSSYESALSRFLLA